MLKSFLKEIIEDFCKISDIYDMGSFIIKVMIMVRI